MIWHGYSPLVGVAEILGTVGLILPAAAGIFAWLTPIAAVALGLLMLLVAGFHARRRESSQIALSVLLLLMTAF